jgi:nicotinate phosphoribosyltransferase
LVDFSLRRTHGSDAGLKVARATYLAGFAGSSNVLAGKLYDLPIFGTMAHSYITSFPHEIESFRVFARNFPASTTLLIDTFDDISGAHHAVTVAKEMEARGERLQYVRLDSGDMAAISKKVRRVLDDNGLDYVRILASSGFDEHKIARVLADGAAIDAFATGTKVGVSADAPYFNIAYKLVRYGDRPVMKLSSGKVTLADKKQVWRIYDAQGNMQRDVIALRHEEVAEGSPRLVPVMAGGRLTGQLPTLKENREYFRDQFAKLPAVYKSLQNPARYPVSLSAGLTAVQSKVEKRIRQQELEES